MKRIVAPCVWTGWDKRRDGILQDWIWQRRFRSGSPMARIGNLGLGLTASAPLFCVFMEYACSSRRYLSESEFQTITARLGRKEFQMITGSQRGLGHWGMFGLCSNLPYQIFVMIKSMATPNHCWKFVWIATLPKLANMLVCHVRIICHYFFHIKI